eukprot:95974-Ditylum_brightwellii.AAC.1
MEEDNAKTDQQDDKMKEAEKKEKRKREVQEKTEEVDDLLGKTKLDNDVSNKGNTYDKDMPPLLQPQKKGKRRSVILKHVRIQ